MPCALLMFSLWKLNMTKFRRTFWLPTVERCPIRYIGVGKKMFKHQGVPLLFVNLAQDSLVEVILIIT